MSPTIETPNKSSSRRCTLIIPTPPDSTPPNSSYSSSHMEKHNKDEARTKASPKLPPQQPTRSQTKPSRIPKPSTHYYNTTHKDPAPICTEAVLDDSSEATTQTWTEAPPTQETMQQWRWDLGEMLEYRQRLAYGVETMLGEVVDEDREEWKESRFCAWLECSCRASELGIGGEVEVCSTPIDVWKG